MASIMEFTAEITATSHAEAEAAYEELEALIVTWTRLNHPDNRTAVTVGPPFCPCRRCRR